MRGRRPGLDAPIGDLARRQHGVVGRSQLRDLGLERAAIESRLRRGTLLRLHQGVYAVGHGKLTTEGRWMAAVLASGPDAVLSHRSAGQLWGLLPRSSATPEVTRPRAFRRQNGIRCHQSTLPEDEVEEVDGIPVTSVSRTIFDLAGVFSKRKLEQAINQAEVLRLSDRLSLPDLLERYPRRRGSSLLRAVLAEAGAGRGVTRSELEERFVALIEAHGLPRPRLNATVSGQGRFLMVDCLWERQRLIVELDGRTAHATAEAFEVDRERDRLLVGQGWRVIRLTWRQMSDESPAIASELRRLLDSQSPEPPHPQARPPSPLRAGAAPPTL
jgi:predicted transcriptional regulator of viral defense system